LSGVSQMHYDLLRSRAIEMANPGVAENLKEMEEAIGVLEKTIAANRDGIVAEIGQKYRPDIDKVKAQVAQEVDADEQKAEAAERAAAQKVNRDEVFAQAKGLSKEARYALVDELLAVNTDEFIGKK